MKRWRRDGKEGREEGKRRGRNNGEREEGGRRKTLNLFCLIFFWFQKENSRASKTVQQVKALAAKPYYANSIPSSHMVDREHTPVCCSPTATLYALSIQQASELRPRGSWGLWLAGRGGSGRRTSKPRSVGTTLSTLTVTLVFSFIIYPHLGRKEQQDTLRLPLAFNITVKVRHVIKGKAARSVLFPCTVPPLSLVLWSCSGSVCQDQAIIHYSMLSSLPGKLCVHAQGLHPT